MEGAGTTGNICKSCHPSPSPLPTHTLENPSVSLAPFYPALFFHLTGTCERLRMMAFVRDWEWRHLWEDENDDTCERLRMTAPVRGWEWRHLWEVENDGTCERLRLRMMALVSRVRRSYSFSFETGEIWAFRNSLRTGKNVSETGTTYLLTVEHDGTCERLRMIAPVTGWEWRH